jgi:hypothetical protein
LIGQASRIRRIVGSLREAITADLTVRFRVFYQTSPLEEHTIGEFTIPSSTPVKTKVVFTTFEHDVLPDTSILVPDVIDSDGSMARLGVAQYLIETVGRGNDLPAVEGVGWMSEWDSGTTYDQDDVVHYGGSTYISLQDSNTNQTPGSSPTYWDLVSSQGDPGPGVATGGTTGQSLVKASGTDYDTTWADRVPTTRAISTTAPLTGGGDLSADRTLAISDFTGDSGSGGAKGAVPAPAAGDTAAGKFLKASGAWAVPSGGSGTVTHTGGALTSDLPIFGAGSDDVKTGTKSGNTNKVVTQGAGSPSVGQPLLYDASGNAIPGDTDQLVPTLPSDPTKFLRGDGTFAVPPGSGGGVAGGYPDNYVQPPTASWSWVNQGSVTEDAANGYLHYVVPSTSDAYRYRAVPGATPWFLRAQISLFPAGSSAFGLSIRIASSNKRLIFFYYSGDGNIYVQRYTGATFNGTAFNTAINSFMLPRLTLGIQDDGTDLKFYCAFGLAYVFTDGLRYTEARATHLGAAPDELGLIMSGGAYTADVLSWETL